MKAKIIDTPQIRSAMEELLSWQKSRAEFISRVEEEENFYRLRVAPKSHRSKGEGEAFAPTSAWLLNTILQKHADVMEHIPTAACLAREPDDEADAKALSAILPVILERNNFEDTYSDNMWFKLKHGVCAFGVFWNSELENGLGDIDLRRVDLRNLYWQPGIRDIQRSRSVYFVERVDAVTLRTRYPHFDQKEAATAFPGLDRAEAGADQVILVDWYYKKRLPSGRTVLHYCKFAGDTVLFASENEEGYENGWYEHGEYPFVLDVLYPIEGECVGFGIIALAKDPQIYIDRMDRNLLEYMDWATRVRFFCKRNTGINEQDFSDLTRRIVEVEGDIDEERLRQIRVDDLDSFWLNLKTAKVNELKETTANRDLLQGTPDGGVTAAAAIAALQEAGNKTIRDMVAASYRAFVRTVRLVLECVRQFYSEARCFRILGDNGEYRYLTWSNAHIAERVTGTLADGTPVCRRPIFDIDVRAEKKDPYTRLSHNEMMKDLYRMGAFKPENAAEAGILLSAMDFSGIGRIREQVAAQASALRGSGMSPEDRSLQKNAKEPLAKAMAGAVALAEKAEREMQ
ncbi:MAG: hypothetical protein E7585_07480 [Ruminococcaceae bacterium]|nr:hypothetical protein [Oscillospiraceae bacterium]